MAACQPWLPPPPAPPAVVTAEFKVTLSSADVGVFISKAGFAPVIPRIREKIWVHYCGHEGSEATMKVTAAKEETAQRVRESICRRAEQVTADRTRHRAQLASWAQTAARRSEQRKLKVLTREETEHRFRSRVERAAQSSMSSNLKILATSQYERDRRGARKHRRFPKQQSPTERKELHGQRAEAAVYCINCGGDFGASDTPAACRFHSGYLTNTSETKARWSCCGQRVSVCGRHDREAEEESHAETGCQTGARHAWRVRKSEEQQQQQSQHQRSKWEKKGAALLKECLEDLPSGKLVMR